MMATESDGVTKNLRPRIMLRSCNVNEHGQLRMTSSESGTYSVSVRSSAKVRDVARLVLAALGLGLVLAAVAMPVRIACNTPTSARMTSV
jgi:hypothetical protein